MTTYKGLRKGFFFIILDRKRRVFEEIRHSNTPAKALKRYCNLGLANASFPRVIRQGEHRD